LIKKYHDKFYDGEFYHLYNRGNNSEIIFKSERNYQFFLQRWQKYIADLLDVYAYCLLPTHFHFFVRVPEETDRIPWIPKLQKFRNPDNSETESIPKPSRFGNTAALDINDILEYQFQLFFRSYALAFNKENDRTGSLFQKGFRRILVNNPRYFTAVIHYIHNNPIHHHYVDAYEKWLFSSYNAILSNKPTHIKREEILAWFGSLEEFVSFHRKNIKYDKIENWLIDED
jgi:REP element-mobilizing transposase RayT